ncbi:MAG: class I SAM-dependent methyltransferase [Chloroflexi bacterium]|nr:class I SAM-dependent methyltransferase [Chloroflexota bacterium]
MCPKSTIASYQAIYREMNFERFGLFRLVGETYSCKEVLYPGCSIHVTPSFVFPYVVYVDKSADAKAFFEDQAELMDFVTKSREYKRKPFIQFLHRDYSEVLPLQPESFDLLLSFFAERTAPVCKKYLRMGGLLLTNQRGEADSDFGLTAVIRFEGGKYRFMDEAVVPVKEKPKKYLCQTARGLEYVENETYFVFKKLSAGSK